MGNNRLANLADISVNYSTKVKPGDWVRITSDYMVAAPLVHLIYEKVVEAGGIPTVSVSSDALAEVLFTKGTKEQLEWVPPIAEVFVDKLDVNIYILAAENTRILSNVDPEKQAIFSKSRRDLNIKLFKRAAEGEVRWTMVQYPCQAFAQEADMSLSDYEDFVFKATYADKDDPVGAWQEVQKNQEKIIQWLNGKKHVEIKGPNCDLSLSIEGRTFFNCCGDKNMPDGEIFTGPVEDSTNGWVEFSYPDVTQGREIDGIRLEFKEGKVVKASASKNEDFLLSQMEIDEGAKYLGELGIGTNYGIDRFTKNMLFDEKIGGTFHLALGAGFPETGSKNESAIHWDMLCDIKEDSEIRVDGELLYKDGKFRI